jgi:hypothetical protein
VDAVKHPRLLAPLVVLLMAGCELLYGIKESGSGVAGAGGSNPATTATSSASGSGQSSGNAGSSTTASSSGATSTSASGSSNTAGSTTSSASSSGASVSFCNTAYAAGPLLCADFDDGGLGGPWTSTNDFSGGITGGVTNVQGYAGTSSYRVVAPAMDDPDAGCFSGRLHKDLGTWGHLHAEFESSVCAGAATNGNAAIAFVTVDCVPPGGPTNTYGMVRWALHESGDELSAYTSKNTGYPAEGGVGATNGAWALVEIDMTYGAAGNVQFTLAGQKLVDANYDFTCDGITQFSIGVLDCPITLPCMVSIDNVLVRVTP